MSLSSYYSALRLHHYSFRRADLSAVIFLSRSDNTLSISGRPIRSSAAKSLVQLQAEG